MKRRHLLTAASSAAVPAFLLAVGRPAQAQGVTTSGTTLSAAEHKLRTLQIGSLSLQTSMLALDRAQNPKVREFAGFERAEQMTIAQVLTDMPAPDPVPLEPSNASILQALSSASNAQFDSMYLADQVQGHSQLYQVQQAFLQGQNNMATDDVHIAMLARTAIQMHLTMLSDLQSSLRG